MPKNYRLKYAELSFLANTWRIDTGSEIIELTKHKSYITALNLASKLGWELADVVVIYNKRRYVLSQKEYIGGVVNC